MTETWLLIVLVVGGFSYSSDFRTATLCQRGRDQGRAGGRSRRW